MDIRKVSAEEWPAVQRIHSVVYNAPRTSFEVTERDAPAIEATWGVFDDGVLVSVLTSHRFEMAYDGEYVKMAGIGGVGTLPEHRRRGHVRRLLEVAFASMHEREEAFSLLYPFSFPYYRMFGYELVYSQDRYLLPPGSMDVRARKGAMEQVLEATPDVRTVYDGFARARNLAMRRGERHWARHVHADPWKDQIFTYLYRDEAGTPRAYVTVRAEPSGPDAIRALVRDIGFDSGSALAALLPHLPSLFPRATRFSLTLPSDVPLELLVAEPYDVEHRREAAMMGRVVDVRRAFEATRLPGSGEIVVGVADDQLDWNTGAWLVRWGEGEVRCEQTGRSPQLSTDIRVLAQLLLGYVDGATALEFGLVESELSGAELGAIFPRKALYQNDHF
ncbi:MAG: GNAT family N-acetyltransferase [Spirochaetota bacterium]